MGNPVTTELKRLVNATRYSIAGFRAVWLGEPAFRTECLALVLALPLAFWLAESLWQFAALIGSILLVMTIEIVNSAIEATIDRIGPERHPLSGQAKDLGSAAVTMAIILALLIWAAMLVEHFTPGSVP